MVSNNSLRSLTDTELLGRLTDLVRQTRRVESELIAHMGEVDARRLYLREAAASMFVYATRVLHLSEAEAYLRIAVARAAREHPVLLARLASGELHLSGAALLAPHLTVDNREGVLARAAHKSKRQIEELVAELSPRCDVPASICKLPDPPTGPAAGPTATTAGCGSARLQLDGRGTDAGRGELRPDGVGSLAAQVPAEFHHRHPYGHGGDRTPDNISLLCRSHNQHLAEIDYGQTAIARHRGGSG
jgi:hypothetical protein